MFLIRLSLRRLVPVVNNPIHHSTSKNTNDLLQWRQQCPYDLPPSVRSLFSVATTCKTPRTNWTVLSLSHQYLVSDSASSHQVLKTNDQKKIDEQNLDNADKDLEEEGSVCPHCGTGFTDYDALKNHIDKTGKGNGGCKELRRINNRKDVLAGIKPHVCDECGIGFKSKGDLNKHKHTHRTLKSFACNQCGNLYKSEMHLHHHILTYHSGQSFPCPKCNKLFSQKSNMRHHLNTVCVPKKEFKCSQCGKMFLQNAKLIVHMTKCAHEKGNKK